MKRLPLCALLLAATAGAQTLEDRVDSLEALHGAELCGNGVINPGAGEVCDGLDMGGQTCEGLGFDGGALACAGCAYDTSGCTTDPPTGAGSWTQLGGGSFAHHFDCGGLPLCGPNGTIEGQSGGVWDSNADCLVLFGGGHADSRYSGLDRYCLGSQSWENLFPSAPIIDPNVCNSVNANGDPVSRHSYGMGAFVPAANGRTEDLYWHYGGSAACNTGTFQRDVWTFGLTSRTWTPHGDNLPNNPGQWFPSCEYDPVTDDVFCIGSPSGWFNAWRWDLAVGGWTRLLPPYSTAFPTTYSSDAVIVNAPGSALDRRIVMANSGRNYQGIIAAGYTPDLVAVHLDSPVVEHFVPAGDGIEILLSMGGTGWNTPGLAWDPTQQKLVMWSGVNPEISSGAIYLIDPETWTATRIDATGGPAFNPNRGVYGRFVFTGAGFLEVHDADQAPYLFTFEE